MIAYIKGKLTEVNTGYVFIETNGIGYQVKISLFTYGEIKDLKEVKLYTYLHITENKHSLYGFATADEKDVFMNLIKVSGIGPNTAGVTLSYMNPDEVRTAIIHDNYTAFNKVKGVGPKTAKRIILDLKDKMVKEMGDVPTIINRPDDTLRREAASALQALGFNKQKISKQIAQVLSTNPDIKNVEDLIKQVLKQL